MNSRIGDFTEDTFEKGQQAVKQSTKSLISAIASQFAPTASQSTTNTPTDSSQLGSDNAQGEQMPQELTDLEQNQPQQQKAQQTAQHQSTQKQLKTLEDKKEKTPQEEAQLEAVRKRLWHEQHMETYYNPTFNHPQRQEEHAAEKVEREKQQERYELQEKEAKKPAPLAVQQGQQSAEKFRGASG